MATNRILFKKWHSNEASYKNKAVLDYLESTYNLKDKPQETKEKIARFIKAYCNNLTQKWRKCNRTLQTFLSKNDKWLDSPLKLSCLVSESQPGRVNKTGGPSKDFKDCSLRTQQRRIKELIETKSPEELSAAAAASSSSGEKDECSFTVAEALGVYVDLDLSERQYNSLRFKVNAKHPNCFPSLYVLKNYKNSFSPKNLTVTETSAQVDLQELVNLTANSISKLVPLRADTNAKLTLKWGMDGSGNHSSYKQKFSDTQSTDSHLLLIAIVPLKLVDTSRGIILWTNPRPASTFYCRPIKLLFSKETPELLLKEESDIKDQIALLENYVTENNSYRFEVNFELLFTMLDGKTCDTLTETKSCASCFICGAAPSQMNLVNFSGSVNQEHFQYGIFPLHCLINSFNCLLHISYRLKFKTWQVRGDKNKAIFTETKKDIQEKFKSKMGLLADTVKVGFGTTNDGNTARTFFNNPKLSSEITGIDERLISNFSKILRVIASGRQFNDKFIELLQETKKCI